MHYYLYKITNTINNKIYIGIHSTTNLDDGYMGSGKSIKSAIKKHGLNNFTKEILEQFDSYEAMIAREKEVVNLEFISTANTYNACIGGQGGQWKGYTKDTHPIVKAWGEKMSIIQKNRYASGIEIWNKGKPNPHAAENGRKSANKLRETVTGRKRKYNSDGSWTWEYPTMK